MRLWNDTTSIRRGEIGMTVVEIVVTMTVVTIFLTVFFGAYVTLESQRLQLSRQALASDIAYSNLRKFSTRPSTLSCDKTTMDLTTAGTKTGADLSSYYTTDSLSSLGAGASASVVAYAVGGCNTDGTYVDAAPVIKIVSTVTYNGDSVSHATFVL